MNNIFTPAVPTWISVLFVLLIPIPVLLIANIVGKASKRTNSFVIVSFYAFYFSYVAWACFNNLFVEQGLPPRILLLCTLPLLIFFIILLNIKPVIDIIDKTKTEDLVRIHIFRLIGSFFLILAIYKAIPLVFGLIAGIGDVLTAASSIFIVKRLRRKESYRKAFLSIWNTFGLLDILATSSTAIIFTKISIEKRIPGVETLAEFPFCFIPAFAPPTIIFLHLAIYRKILKKDF